MSLSSQLYSGGTGYTVTPEPVISAPTVTLPPSNSPTPTVSGGGSTTTVGTNDPIVPISSGITYTGPATATSPNGTPSPTDPLSALLNQIIGPGAGSASAQPAQITTVSPTPASASVSKTWLIVGAVVVGVAIWYFMKKKKAAGTSASA